MRSTKNLEGEGIMFNKITKKDKRTDLEKEIDTLISKLSEKEEGSDEYDDIISAIDRLVGIRNKMKNKDGDKVSKDTIVIVAGNLLGILLILGYEKANVITSKALGFVLKGRV
jgi:hypothetical protein